MDQTTILVLLIGAAAIGLVAAILILRRERKETEDAAQESPFAVATEGMKRCPACGVANLVTEETCSACGKRLPE
jgi:hypothetical protein